MPEDKYAVVEVLRAGSLLAVITRRIRDNQLAYSFQLRREFERGEEKRETYWFEKRHLKTVQELLDQARATIDRLEDADRAELRAKVKTPKTPRVC